MQAAIHDNSTDLQRQRVRLHCLGIGFQGSDAPCRLGLCCPLLAQLRLLPAELGSCLLCQAVQPTPLLPMQQLALQQLQLGCQFGTAVRWG